MQLALLLKGLTEFAESWAKEGKREEMVQVAKVFQTGGVGALDQINLRKLDEYLQKSKIARKVCLTLRRRIEARLTLPSLRRLAVMWTASRRRRRLLVRALQGDSQY
jgi:hypothetical protein